MKKRSLWIVSGIALATLAVVGLRLSAKRNTPPPAAISQAPAALELAASDVLTVRTESLALGLPVSGTLKSTQTAFVKARVAGELMDLVVREGDTAQAGQVIARIDPTE